VTHGEMLGDGALGIGPHEGDVHGTIHLDDDTQVTVATIHTESKKTKATKGVRKAGTFRRLNHSANKSEANPSQEVGRKRSMVVHKETERVNKRNKSITLMELREV
jgi:hypothetical protein